MDTKLESIGTLERKLTVTVPAGELQSKYESKVQELSKTVQLNGFRNKQVPAKVIKMRFGKQIKQEILGDCIGDTYRSAIEENKLDPAAMPDIQRDEDSFDIEKDFQYTATFEVFPEIQLNAIDKIQLEDISVDLSDDDVDFAIEKLLEQHITWAEVERPAQQTDQVIVDIREAVGDEPFPEEFVQNVPLQIISEENSQVIPGLIDSLPGKNAGEQFEVSLNFPDTWPEEESRGKAVRYEIKIQHINEKQVPELNEEFFTKFNPEITELEPFKAHVKEQVLKELDQLVERDQEFQLLDQIVKLHEFDLPKSLVHREEHALEHEVQRHESEGREVEGKDSESLAKLARKRVATGLIIKEFSKINNLNVTREDMENEVAQMAKQFGFEDSSVLLDYYLKNESMASQMEYQILMKKVIDSLKSQVSHQDKPMTYREFIDFKREGA